MKYMWSFIFSLNSLFFPYSLAYGATPQLDNAALSVWKTVVGGDLNNTTVQSTGFFIGPNYFVENSGFLNAAIAFDSKTTKDGLSIHLITRRKYLYYESRTSFQNILLS